MEKNLNINSFIHQPYFFPDTFTISQPSLWKLFCQNSFEFSRKIWIQKSVSWFRGCCFRGWFVFSLSLSLYTQKLSILRGITGPAHAIHFASYEFCKQMLGGNQVGHHPIANASAGIIAAVISEAVMTPCDSIKQKLQMGRSSGILKCIRTTYTTLGMRRGFYSGYTSALTMVFFFVSLN